MASTWIPEDDLLLKNAVEAGASLEALAKGAIQFSRRFTFHELRDRWHSLLYDPDISTQASARMVEHEHSSKLNGVDNFKRRGEVNQKRKIGSIRRQYYGMRKRIRSELLTSTDLGFLSGPRFNDGSGHGGNFQGHLRLDELQDENCMLGDGVSDTYGFEETHFDILRRVFPETLGDIVATSAVDETGNEFHSGHQNAVQDNCPSRIVRKENPYGFPEDASSMRNDGRGSFEPSGEHKDACHVIEDNSMIFGQCMNVDVIDPSHVPPDGKPLGSEDSETKQLASSYAMHVNSQSTCSGFGVRQHFNSPDSDGCASLHTMGFSSPLPRLPLWKTMEDISAPAMPVIVSCIDRTQGPEGTSALPDDGDSKKESPSGTDVHSEPLLRDGENGGDLINASAVSVGEFADLSDSLLNFTNDDELLFMDVDVKEMMDKSCCENLNVKLVSSTSNAREGDVCKLENKACPSGLDNIASSVPGDQQGICHSKVQVQTPSVLVLDTPEISSRNTYCTLNTEDPEIPCNDDIFLLIHPATSFPSSSRRPIILDSCEPLSSSADEKDNERGHLMDRGKDPAQSFTRSQVVGPSMLPESVQRRPLVGCVAKSDVPVSERLALLPVEVNKAGGVSKPCRSTNAAPVTIKGGVLEEDVSKVESKVPATLAAFTEKPLHAGAGSIRTAPPESVGNPSTSDLDESDSDSDVPYFSDIEAMILEMDLGPHEEDSYINRRVSRYQYEDTKRTIIRLEQCARSSMQRAMSSHGALAILYGRRLKHYIRKTEVMLGRSTDDTDVDIDLRKEGRANQISRRQAMIKMGTDGSFSLKNLGKSSISVNGKAVATGNLLGLSSSCLIEIRGMSFVFEINHRYVRQYVDSISKKHQVCMTFEPITLGPTTSAKMLERTN
ncbi:hypothetical protein RJ639_036263 [Escallonia herrerae]|uniref:FHA domain-containing protein n=1 Tax=Escallonia herrerae TaxID=1293975 RepID=A0AA88WQR7_9ASTE|nr:hypothetical protein RJ639_036263 [Escallonia herrerae]